MNKEIQRFSIKSLGISTDEKNNENVSSIGDEMLSGMIKTVAFNLSILRRNAKACGLENWKTRNLSSTLS